MKLQVNVDEKWPFFELVETKSGHEEFHFDIPEEMYKEYCYIMYKYHEFQLKLQALYELGNNQLNKRFCRHNVSESSKLHDDKIRDDELTQAPL